MKPALRLGLSQSLTLTPQLKLAIRLLQLSSLELEQEIQLALDSNPVLEIAEAAAEPGAEPAAHESEAANDGSGFDTAAPAMEDRGGDSSSIESPEVALTDADWSATAPEGAFDGFDDWTPAAGGSESRAAADFDGESEDASSRAVASESLAEHLLWQLNLTPFTARDRAIAELLIDALDDDGYLREPVQATQAALGDRFAASEAEIETVRQRLMHFEPTGIAARSVEECLAIQLAVMPADEPGRDLARLLIGAHMALLARGDCAALAARCAVTTAEIDTALRLIRGLVPKPGLAYSSGDAGYIEPDVMVDKVEGRWRVRLSRHAQPALSINRHYESMAATVRGDTGSYLRGRLQEARWLMKSLAQRGETLLKVANSVVRLQGAFLDYGPEAMRPLTLREVADEIGVHESTVSRITTRKYLHTPRGTFELKHFFSVGLATNEGGEASATAVRAMIGKLIADEDPKKPLSDQALADHLKARGIAVARRTVAKYREAMNIPSSSDRCRLA